MSEWCGLNTLLEAFLLIGVIILSYGYVSWKYKNWKKLLKYTRIKIWICFEQKLIELSNKASIL